MDAGRAGDAVSSAFARIAEELVESMMRNLAGHRAEELVEGFEWAQWQALALQSLMDYSRRNAVAYGPEFDRLNDLIEQAIRQAWEDGGADAEAQILEAVRSGWTPPAGAPGDNPGAPAGGSFFQVPERRLDALVKATHDDMMRAEHALLRKADDVYRETVLAAQVYGTSGAGTLAKAVDMAAKDFLGKGICCIEYADGSVHSIEEYSRMAVRTAVKRAQLAGDGSKRAEWGVHTVIVARNAQGCGKCAQWSGQVLVDDVYSGGTAAEAASGGWSLLSSAMAAGLFHPNCRDMTSTWFPGLSPEPDPPTAAQQEAADRRERAEQAETHAKTQARRYGRMSRLALDEGDRERYAAKAVEWEMRAEEVADAVPAAEPADAFVPAGTLEEAEEYIRGFVDMDAYKAKVDVGKMNLDSANGLGKALHDVSGLYSFELRSIQPMNFRSKDFKGSTADASYKWMLHDMYFNPNYYKSGKALDAHIREALELQDQVMGSAKDLVDGGRLRKATEGFARGLLESGRGNVANSYTDRFAEATFTHELGHALDDQVFRKLFKSSGFDVRKSADEFAAKVSGYATMSNQEYVAESFTAYMFGEVDRLDPALVRIFEEARK